MGVPICPPDLCYYRIAANRSSDPCQDRKYSFKVICDFVDECTISKDVWMV